ncbi:MAG: hypothetical protein IKN59_05990 [Paludibacteraceae bacterium]|nr:hypothetical protein [Paludibacteraceae bacterium]
MLIFGAESGKIGAKYAFLCEKVWIIEKKVVSLRVFLRSIGTWQAIGCSG